LIVRDGHRCGLELFEVHKQSLRVLQWDIGISRIITQRSLHGITQLRFTYTGEDIDLLGSGVIFPEVQMLWLALYVMDSTEFVLSTWKFPKLRRLRLWGHCFGIPGDDAIRFMLAHASMITELVLCLNVHTNDGKKVAWTLIDDFWNAFPRLSLLGSEWINFKQVPPSPNPNGTGPSVGRKEVARTIIDDFWNAFPLLGSKWKNFKQVPPSPNPNATGPSELLMLDFPLKINEESIPILQDILPAWHADRVIAQVSWDEARRLIEKSRPSLRHKVIKLTRDFLKAAMGWDIPFCDAHRVTITDWEGQAFITWLLEELEESMDDPEGYEYADRFWCIFNPGGDLEPAYEIF